MSFMTEPDTMRDYSGRFANHASNIHADAQKAFASWRASRTPAGQAMPTWRRWGPWRR